MEYIIHRESNGDYLEHYGIKGQKWGVRRYENADGTLTEEGKKRYIKAQKNASQYVSAKDRLKKIGKSAGIGAAVGGLFTAGAVAPQVGAEYLRPQKIDGIRQILPDGSRINLYKQRSVFNAVANTLSANRFGNAKTIAAYTLAGGLAGAAISGIKQGYQAIKVKRGQQFIEKYKDAYEKTYGRQN